jgi:DNA-binding MarR family transcriptional regulator
MDRFERIVNNLFQLGTSMFVIHQRGKKPITRDPEYIVLSMLMEEKLAISEIGNRLHRSKPCMSALIRRLIREGKVRRIPSRADRRVTRIAITSEGRSAIRAKRRELKEWIQGVSSPLSDDEVAMFDSCLAVLNSTIARTRIG